MVGLSGLSVVCYGTVLRSPEGTKLGAGRWKAKQVTSANFRPFSRKLLHQRVLGCRNDLSGLGNHSSPLSTSAGSFHGGGFDSVILRAIRIRPQPATHGELRANY